MAKKITKTEEQWRDELDELAYHVTREGGTERAFTGPLYENKKEGSYHCVCCGAKLFSSTHKYASGSGWPSFYQPAEDAPVEERTDKSYGMVRTEVLCQQCDAHLGHVFPDGPRPTGLRYCINSAALSFKEKEGN